MSDDKSMPAFPVTVKNISSSKDVVICGQVIKPKDEIAFHGMTLRDYFAAKALAGYRTNHEHLDAETVAYWSYRDADAMLLRRVR